VFSLAATTLIAGEQQQLLSKVYPIVKKYKSMEGPSGIQTIYLGDRGKPELLWLTAIKTEVVDARGRKLMSPELMCHMNVDIDPVRHKALFNLERFPAARLMTISQGMRVAGGGFAARLPDGFAFPIASNEPLYVMTQVLNHNIEHPKHLNVRHRVTFEFVRDRDLTQRPIPLFNLGVSGMVEMTSSSPTEHSGASCLIGMRAPNAAGMSSDYIDPHGRHMTGHWVVPPGKQVNASDVTWFMNLPYDSKLHYAAVHLHPFAQSLTLRDTTIGADVFKAQAVNPKRRVGLDRVDAFVSVAGVPLYKDHKYELVSVYDNPTHQNADSMASMFLALDDPEFVAPTAEQLIERGTIITDNSGLILRTSAGDFGAMLQNSAATLQFAKLVAAGAFRDGEAKVTNSTITFSAKVTIPELTRQSNDQAMPGAIALCRTDDEVSFVIFTQKQTDLDARCILFAMVGPGAEVVRSITSAGSARLIRAEIFSGPELNDIQLAPAKKPVAQTLLSVPAQAGMPVPH
jgi:hypothetical protein